MKTMLALAQELDIPKLKVYRCIKKHSIETHQKDGVIYLDETGETQVKSILQGKFPYQGNTSDIQQSTSDEKALIHLLQQTIERQVQQLEAKDKQISELIELNRNQQVLLKQEQDRHRPWFQRLFLPAGKP